jgi:hypothetical protein
MLIRPLKDSAISIVSQGSSQIISIPPAKKSAMTYFVGAFMLFWLGGWAFGEISVVRLLLTGTPETAQIFLVFWLCAWTVGGIYAFASVRRIFQRSVAESITLEPGGLVRDSGVPPYEMPTSRSFSWKAAFPKRTTTRIESRSLSTLRLREGDGGNRLTVDAGVERMELAKAATDVEREWLFQVLSERYGLGAPR